MLWDLLYTALMTLGLVIAAFAAPCSGYAATAEKDVKEKGYKEIHTADLKKLYDSKTPFLILMPRKKITVGVLPGAKPMAYDASEKTIANAVKHFIQRIT